MSDQNTAKTAGADLGMDAFFTRDRANEGIEVPLYLPTGQKSPHWLRVLGVDSDAFRTAEAEAKRDAFRIASIDDLIKRADEMVSSKRKLVAALVVSWSFDKPCSRANVEEFLRQAPQIMDAIDVAASRRALFFGPRSSSSQPTPSDSSSST